MMSGDKEKSMRKSPINRRKKNPPFILASECNKSETEMGTRSSLREQTLWQKGGHRQEEGAQGSSEVALGRSSRTQSQGRRTAGRT